MYSSHLSSLLKSFQWPRTFVILTVTEDMENLINTFIRTQHRTLLHITIYITARQTEKAALITGASPPCNTTLAPAFTYIIFTYMYGNYSLAILFYDEIKHKYTWLINQVFAIFYCTDVWTALHSDKSGKRRVEVFCLGLQLYVSTQNTLILYYIHHAILQTCIPTNKSRSITGKSTNLSVE